MPSPYDKVKEAIEQIKAKYKELTGDGKLSWQDMLGLFANCVATITKLVMDTFADLDIEQKKILLLQLIGEVYDEIIAPIDIKPVPNVIEPIVDRLGRSMLMNFAEAWIDAAIEIFTRKDDVTPFVPPGPEPFKPVPFTPYLPMYAKG